MDILTLIIFSLVPIALFLVTCFMLSGLRDRINDIEKEIKKLHGIQEREVNITMRLRKLEEDVTALHKQPAKAFVVKGNVEVVNMPKCEPFWDYSREVQEGILAKKIAEENVSVRLYVLLNRLGIETMGQLCTLNREGLLDSCEIGRKSMEEITLLLNKYGLSLEMNLSEFGYGPDGNDR